MGTLVALALDLVVAALLLLAGRPDLAALVLVFVPIFVAILIVEVIVWARRRSGQPTTRPTVSCVCGKRKPRGLRAFMDDEAALDSWWKACPEGDARYCDEHRGLLWMPGDGVPPLKCLECEHEWELKVPRGHS